MLSCTVSFKQMALMESPAVTGLLTYKQLCATAKQEKKRLTEISSEGNNKRGWLEIKK